MHARTRFALPVAVALSIASLVIASPARAQDAVVATAASPAVATMSDSVTTAQPATTPAGPTIDAAAVGVRHASVTTTAAPAPRGGYGQPVALMVVGGAAVIVGLLINGGAGTAIAIAGAVAGLYGLYQYLQ